MINFIAQLGVKFVPIRVKVRVLQKTVNDETTWFILCHQDVSLDYVLEQLVNRLLLTCVRNLIYSCTDNCEFMSIMCIYLYS